MSGTDALCTSMFTIRVLRQRERCHSTTNTYWGLEGELQAVLTSKPYGDEGCDNITPSPSCLACSQRFCRPRCFLIPFTAVVRYVWLLTVVFGKCSYVSVVRTAVLSLQSDCLFRSCIYSCLTTDEITWVRRIGLLFSVAAWLPLVVRLGCGVTGDSRSLIRHCSPKYERGFSFSSTKACIKRTFLKVSTQSETKTLHAL
jgi:hypothetical protein